MTACTRVLTLDDEIVFRAPDAPVEQIRTLLRLYRRGLSEPLPFFPKTAWSYLEDSVKDGAKHPLKNSAHPDGARAYHANRASQAWYPTPQNPHAEGDDPAYRLALRGQREVLGEDFRRVAAQVFEPVLRHLERRT
jgi:exodeoxyribonuclease V gamma subunit